MIEATLTTTSVPVTRATASPDVLKAAEKYAKEQYLACTFIFGADRKRYGRLLENLENDFTQKTERWPKTITDAYSLLINWKQDPRNLLQVLGASSDGVAFTKNVGENKGTTLAAISLRPTGNAGSRGLLLYESHYLTTPNPKSLDTASNGIRCD